MKWKPYPSYFDSGVGLIGPIPTHWKTHRIKHLASIRLSNVDKLTVEGEAPVRLANYVDVYKNERITADMDLMAATASTDQIARLSLLAGDVLITKDSETPDDIGVPAFVPETPEGVVCGYHLAMLRPDPGRLHGAFLHRWLQGNVAKAHFSSHATGMTRYGLGKSDIGDAPMLWAPLEEQAAITTFLDRETAKIDTLIAEQRTLIERLHEKRIASITQAVTRGINPAVQMQPLEFAWFPETPIHWKVRRVKNLCTFTTSGPRGWSERVGDAGNLFIQSGDLNSALGIEFTSAKRVLVEAGAEADRTRLLDGDVVVCITGAKTGNVAICSMPSEAAYINQHLCLIRPNHDVKPAFLGHFLKSDVGQTYFELSQYGLKQGLGLQEVRETPISLPPIAEQESILERIELEIEIIDGLIAEAGTSIALLLEHRSALITAVVTGKVDVRGAVA